MPSICSTQKCNPHFFFISLFFFAFSLCFQKNNVFTMSIETCILWRTQMWQPKWEPLKSLCVLCFSSLSLSHGSEDATFFLVSYVLCFLIPHRNDNGQFPLCLLPLLFFSVYVIGCVCVCVMPLVCSFICSSSFSITSLAFTLAVNAVWLQSLVGKWKVCLCWTMSWTLTSHLTSTQGCDWTCYPAEGLQVTW